jgi:Raf kinase inhibitor-like YbhB/YbcL family protein
MLRDTNGDGRVDLRRTIARRPLMHGIEIDGRTAYLVAGTSIYRAPILADGSFGPLEEIVHDLPDTGQHSAREINKGPDGMLYISVGSTCNACDESSPESATILRMSPDGKSRTIYASGLRHTVGFDWHPRSGQLWGMDHGIDWLGDRQQVEELNRIEQGKAYGWPYIYGMGGHNPQDEPPGELTMEDWDRMSQRAVLGYDAHAAPMQMTFYRGGMFPAGEQGNAFVAMRGSWNRKQPSGYEIVRVRYGQDGTPAAIEPFVTGLLTSIQGGGFGHRGRPVGLAVARDGALLFTDDVNGVIYRVSYAGPDAARAALPKPVMARPQPLEPRPRGEALALARPETQASGRLTVSSPDFRAGGAIPSEHSAYFNDVSPELRWSALPAGTRSVALLMEDPDAAVGKPFVHWVAWNIPPNLTGLPEAVGTAPQLPDMMNMRQGRNTRGSTGYYGPRPPVGDRPHHYHFQLFALDTLLNINPGSDRETLLAAMQGHVLAKGELVGTFRQATPPSR